MKIKIEELSTEKGKTRYLSNRHFFFFCREGRGVARWNDKTTSFTSTKIGSILCKIVFTHGRWFLQIILHFFRRIMIQGILFLVIKRTPIEPISFFKCSQPSSHQLNSFRAPTRNRSLFQSFNSLLNTSEIPGHLT